MPGYRHILVAVDLGDPTNTERELRRAREIAEASDARITLLTVRPPRPLRYNTYLPSTFDADEQAHHEAELLNWAETLSDTARPVTLRVRAGRVVGEVLAEARAAKADLIIIGAHQPNTASRLLGSNAERIVRESEISVLIAR